MPAHIDPAWEYWTPDPEVAEAMASGRSTGFGGLPRSKCRTTGKCVAAGFRFGRGTPDSDPTRFAPPRWERPDRLPLARCKACPRLFTPRDRETRYCGRACFTEGRTTCRPIPCAGCGAVFKPAQHGRRACSRECGGVLIRAVKAGVPLTLDWPRVAALFVGGMTLADVAREVGAGREAVRNALRSQGVYRPGRSGRPRTLPDRACLNPACGATFRPRDQTHTRCSPSCGQLTRPDRKKVPA